jgi:signal transduction histidine kinase
VNINFQELTILIIDDSALDCGVYNTYLLDRHSSTEPIGSLTCVADAVNLCQVRSPDLILLKFDRSPDRGRDFIAALQLEAGDLLLPPIGIWPDLASRASCVAMKSASMASAGSCRPQPPLVDRCVTSLLPERTLAPHSLSAKLTDPIQLLAQRDRELAAFEILVSQELRAPIKGIANLATWLLEDLESYLTPDTHKQFELLRSRIRRMNLSIDSLVDYTQAGRQPITRSLVNVGQLITKIIESFDLTAGFSIEIAAPMPTFRTDRLALQQVFTNLLENAIKHHDVSRKTLHKRADGCVRIAAHSQQNCYLFEIVDDGPGIAPHDRERIFEVFQSLSPHKDDTSIGMGLAIAQKQVELQGGKLWVDSIPGVGSKFSFTWLTIPPEL